MLGPKKVYGLKKQTAAELRKLQQLERKRAHKAPRIPPIGTDLSGLLRVYSGTTTATHNAGATQGVTRHKVDGTAGTITDQVKNPFGKNIGNAKFVVYLWLNGGFKIIAADC